MILGAKHHVATLDTNDINWFHVKGGSAGRKWTNWKLKLSSPTRTTKTPDKWGTYRLLSTLRERGRYAYGSGLPFFFTSPFAFLAWYSTPVVTDIPLRLEEHFVGRWMPEPPAETKHETSKLYNYEILL